MTHGLVTTIIPVYNRPDMLRKAVASVLIQSYRPIEIIIVDDGSTDETGKVAEDLAIGHPDIIRVITQENGGPGSAREKGRRAAAGEFIQYLDSDDLLMPLKFESQVEALRNNPDCGIAYGITELIDENGTVLVSPYKWTGRRVDQLFPSLLVDRWWNTHTPLYRRSLCDTIGAWSGMRMGEDWEYDARAGALKTRLAYCPLPVSQHRCHKQQRLTGGRLNHGKLRDIARLIGRLFEYARNAEVSFESTEMSHFSRWAFLVARQAGAAGLTDAARDCFDIARTSAGKPGIDVKVYGVLAGIVGWKVAGTLACLADSILKRTPGQDTLRQSWMEADGRKP
jgi:glycosyltransferase involved in cell wall biosynthesis